MYRVKVNVCVIINIPLCYTLNLYYLEFFHEVCYKMYVFTNNKLNDKSIYNTVITVQSV